MYPEIGAGGYSRVDHRMEYVVRVNSLLQPGMTLLEFGAGRGKWINDSAPLRWELGNFRNRCSHVIGADIDPAVLQNEMLHERLHIEPGKPLPLADESVHIISAFSVFEHLEQAEFYAREFTRVLKPGGWLCAWTPNLYGYVAVGARLVPHSLHRMALRLLEPNRVEADSFPPLYKMNSRRTLKRLFPPAVFSDFSYTYNGQPFYHAERVALARFWQFTMWLTPPPLHAFLYIFMRKKGAPPAAPLAGA